MTKIFKIASIAIVALIANTATAQVNQTQLNVNLANAYSVVVNPAQSSVTIDMNQPAHFQAGNNSGEQVSHLQVSASGDYEVKVSALGNLVAGSETIAVNTVTVTPTTGTYLGTGTDPGSNSTCSTQPIEVGAANELTVISSSTGDLRNYNVVYTIPADETAAYLDHSPGVYTATVVYTIYAN
jgi:hypothetical protein